LDDKEVLKQFVCSKKAKFRQLTSESVDIEKELLLFRSAIIASGIEYCRENRLRVVGNSEKRIFWWNQCVKEAIRAKKDAFKTLLPNRSSFNFQFPSLISISNY